MKKKLNIGFLVSVFPADSETFILNQICGLQESGFQVRIYSESRTDCPVLHPLFREQIRAEQIVYWGVRIPNKWICRRRAFRLALKGLFRMPRMTWKLFRGLRARPDGFSYPMWFLGMDLLLNRIEILHCHFGLNGQIGAELKQIDLPFTLITTFHGFDVNSYPLKEGMDVYEELFKTGDLFTANTQFTAEQVQRLGCPPEKIRILPVGLDPGRFPFQERDFPKDGAVNLLTIARFVEKKGHIYALKAFQIVQHQYPNARYILAGRGPLEAELKNWTQDHGLDNAVVFAGALDADQIRVLYQKAHLFILPSVTARDGDKEGQGLVLQEAQAVGLPVVSTQHNGIPEGVLEGQSGYLVPERDPEALAERILHLIEHPEHWADMGKAGRKFVEEKYDIRKLNDQLIGLYRELSG